MPTTILIDPVTRIEGHAKITLQLDSSGRVADARFHVVEFRGFEKFCEGRPYTEMPGITARICGICPVSHLLASAKAGDAIMAVSIPPAADRLRRLMNLGQFIQSHALSLFYLSFPDLLLGWEAPPAERNIFGLMANHAELARSGIRLRQFGQEIIEVLGGKKIHPAWAVPGGVRAPLSAEGRDRLRLRLPEAYATVASALSHFRRILERNREEAATFGEFRSLFLALAAEDGTWEHHGGRIRIVDSDGFAVAEDLDPGRYGEFLAETAEPSSYLKSPYYRPRGPEAGMYRVGPLARLNVCKRMGTAKAEAEWRDFRALGAGAVTSSFLYHYARLIEILACVERVEMALDDPLLLGSDLRADAGVNQLHGVGASEAPRGTLFHDYAVDRDGLIQRANFLIATGQNNLAMNRTVAQIARRYVQGESIPEPVLNRIEAGIRCYDPCLSCSTHAAGRMPLQVRLVDAGGRLLHQVERS